MKITSGSPKPYLQSIRRIFFASSSRQNFSDEGERERFFQKWTEYYLSECPQYVYVGLSDQKEVLGYLMGCPDSAKALGHFSSRLKSYGLFADLFGDFPAHLHINLDESARGHGLGGKLIEAFVRDLKNCRGVHIVTSPEARNVSFYRKNGFTFETTREQNGVKLLFMGRSLYLGCKLDVN